MKGCANDMTVREIKAYVCAERCICRTFADNEKEKYCAACILGAVPEETVDCKDVVEKYNSICGDVMPKVVFLSDRRKTAIRTAAARLKKAGMSFEQYFRKAAGSDFLSGKSGKWNNCSFDWLLTASNMVKVLEGNYDRAERNNIVNENSSFDIDELYAAALRRGSMG